MYCLRLFYIVYFNVYRGAFIEKYVYTKFRLIGCYVSEIHAHLYRAVFKNYIVYWILYIFVFSWSHPHLVLNLKLSG